VECYKDEKDDSSNSLNQVKPIARVRIVQIVWPRFNRNYQAIDGVIDQGYKDAAYLNEENVWNSLQVFDCFVEISSAAKGLGVCVKVFQQKDSERDNSRQLM
jgi:hypothetical protein